MKSPLSVICHVALLIAIAYHALTWFKLFPLTMPPIIINGKRVEPCVVIGMAGRQRLSPHLPCLDSSGGLPHENP